MGIKGLSRNVIKLAWREGHLSHLPAGTRVGVDGAGWLHKACVANAMAICLHQPTSQHHQHFLRQLHQLLDVGLKVVLVFDGAEWPLRQVTSERRRHRAQRALARAHEELEAGDRRRAESLFKQAVRVPAGFVGWVLHHVAGDGRVDVRVANYEADAQLAELQRAGHVDLVYSAAQDSDFLLYSGMRHIMYNVQKDGSYRVISLADDVLGNVVGSFSFIGWNVTHFRAWCAACGCDYVDNPKGWGAIKLHRLVSRNLGKSERELLSLLAGCAEDASAYAVDLLAAVRSFQHHVVFRTGNDDTVSQVHLEPLPDAMGFTTFRALDSSLSKAVYDGVLDPTTLQPRYIEGGTHSSTQRPAQPLAQHSRAKSFTHSAPHSAADAPWRCNGVACGAEWPASKEHCEARGS